MELSILAMGFLIGLKHAIEPDHIAAVSNILATDNKSNRLSVYGFIWGIGHTLSLFILGGAVVAFGFQLSDSAAVFLESLVGAMLIFLGGQLVYKLWKDMIHIHPHTHGSGKRHIHIHSHKKSDGHTNHHKVTQQRPALKTLLVGLMHGLAGSASLIVLAATATSSPMQGLIFVGLFGIGSCVGMGILTTIIALPVSWASKSANKTFQTVQFVLGLASVVIGSSILLEGLAS